MELVTLKCPHCGAALDIEDGLDVLYCKYCGTKLLVDGAYDSKMRLKEYEHIERMVDKEYRYQRFVAIWDGIEDKSRLIICFIIILMIVGVITIPTCSHRMEVAELKRIENDITTCIQAEKYEEALTLTNRLYLDDGWSSSEKQTWEDKRKEYRRIINSHLKEQGSVIAEDEQNEDEGWDWWPFD